MRDTRPPYDAALAERVRQQMFLIPPGDPLAVAPPRDDGQAPPAAPTHGRSAEPADR